MYYYEFPMNDGNTEASISIFVGERVPPEAFTIIEILEEERTLKECWNVWP